MDESIDRHPAAPEAESEAAGAAGAAGTAGVPRQLNRRQLERRRPRRAAAWGSKDVLRAAMLVFALYFGLQLLWEVHPLILTGFIGLLFGLGVARGADYLERIRVPRGIAAGLIVLSTYGALFGVMAIAAPTLEKQFGELRRRLPEALDRVDQWVAANRGSFWGQLLEGSSGGEGAPAQAAAQAPLPAPTPALHAGKSHRGGATETGAPPPAPAANGAAGAAAQPPGTAPLGAHGATGAHAARPGGAPPGAGGAPAAGATGAGVPGAAAGAPSPLRIRLVRQLGAASRYLFPFLSSTLEVLVGLLLITFVAIYFSVDPEVYRRGLLHLVPHPSRQRVDEVITAIGVTLRRFLSTQLIAMVVIGSMVSITLALLGVEAALSLGIIAGVLEFIPTIGPILSALPAIAMGFLVSPEKALEVAIAFTLVELVEGHVLIPMLMKRGMNLPPLITILSQAMMGVVFGFLGLLVAVPLVATVLTAVKMLYVNDVMGDDLRTGTPAD
ncbi:MAG TPA: AI-2E family transporter [Thermoanaerobaculia bacterium]|nr:AI-2E family transporter [Thermoanaerobaculia bacterium]